MFCHKCGTQLSADSRFCHKCGVNTVVIETQIQPINNDRQAYQQPEIQQQMQSQQTVSVSGAVKGICIAISVVWFVDAMLWFFIALGQLQYEETLTGIWNFVIVGYMIFLGVNLIRLPTEYIGKSCTLAVINLIWYAVQYYAMDIYIPGFYITLIIIVLILSIIAIFIDSSNLSK